MSNAVDEQHGTLQKSTAQGGTQCSILSDDANAAPSCINGTVLLSTKNTAQHKTGSVASPSLECRWRNQCFDRFRLKIAVVLDGTRTDLQRLPSMSY